MSLLDRVSDLMAIALTVLLLVFYVFCGGYTIYYFFQFGPKDGQFAAIAAALFGAVMGLGVAVETFTDWREFQREWIPLIRGYTESLAVAFLSAYFTFIFLFFGGLLVTIHPALTAALIVALIAFCAYLAIKWFSGREEQTAPEAPPIQSDDTKLEALAATARPARGVALDTPPKTETKEIRNVYSGAR